MANAPKPPRISANKLGEYMSVGPTRRRAIIYDAKFPSDAIRPFYTQAEEAISQFIASGLAQVSILENRIKLLGQSHAKTVWEQRRVNGNIDAIEAFMAMLDAIDLKGAVPELGSHKPPHLNWGGVDISVRPEIILKGKSVKGADTVGALKIHFPKTHPLGDEAAAYISTVAYNFANTHLGAAGNPDGKLCGVIDVASGKFHHGIASTKQRTKDLQAACLEIASLWPTITP